MARQRRTSEEWKQLIAEYDAGDETIKAFCLRHALPPQISINDYRLVPMRRLPRLLKRGAQRRLFLQS